MTHSDHGPCWCCQGRIDSAQSIQLSDDARPIPCCKECWLAISEGQRLLIAHKFAQAPLHDQAIELLIRAARRAIDDYDEPDDPFGLRPNWEN